MPVVYKRPSSLAAGWSRQIGYFVLVFLITIWVGHRFFGFATSNAVAVSMLALGLALFGFASLQSCKLNRMTHCRYVYRRGISPLRLSRRSHL